MSDSTHMSKLVKDWFGRRAEDSFTFYDERNRFFSWDKDRSRYSSFFVKDDDDIREAAKVVGSMLRVVGVPKTFRYSSNLKDSKYSATPTLGKDENTLQIPLSMLKKEGEWVDMEENPGVLDAFYGASIQNAAQAAMQTTSEFNALMSARTKKNPKLRDLFFAALGTERIDKKLSDRLPGYTRFVQKFKDYTYDRLEHQSNPDDPAQKRLAELILKMLRYPSQLSESELEEFDKPIKQIERLLKRHGGIPETLDDCSSMAGSLANIVYKYVEEEEEPPKEPGDDSSEDGEGGGDPPPTGGSGKPGSPSMSREELDKEASRMMSELMNPDEGEGVSEEDMEMFEDGMEPGSKAKSEEENEYKYHSGSITACRQVVFRTAKSNKANYQDELRRIDVAKASTLQKLFQRKSKHEEFVMKAMRSGRLDTNKIAEARQNVPTIYERMGTVNTNRVTVGVLIDESGSMGGEKIQKARQAAIFINEVFKRMRDVDYFCYGHTADVDGAFTTRIHVYHEKGTTVDPYTLGTCNAHSQNRDGDAIYAVAKRIRERTKNQGILFVLSDGAPYAGGYSGKEAILHTRSMVSKAQSMGFQVIQIAIEESVPSKEMFDYFIKLTNIKTLPNDMANYMSRIVDKMIKETVTL